MAEDLTWATATELSARIRARDVSPVEVVDALLERISALDEELNHFCLVLWDEAREAARVAEEAVMRGGSRGLLHGVPYALKDFTPTRGLTTTLGSRAYSRWVPDHDAPVVERLRAAGGILLGKTLTPEFAYSGFTHSPLWGVARNPWDRARNTGGSSGGSAGAVAAGMVPLAEGSDAGGSIRIPASFCGVVGFKPALGRVPFHLTANDFDSIWHVGPIARSVGDVALMFAVMQGPDERDPLSIPGERRADSPAYTLAALPPGLRLALSVDLGYYDVDSEVEANTRAAAEALRDAGADVREVELGWSEEINVAWSRHWNVALAALYGDVADRHRDVMDPEVVAMIDEGRTMKAVDLKRTELVRSRQWASLRLVLESHHALLCPTTAVTAPAAETSEAGYRRPPSSSGGFAGYELACPFNFIGQCPVISVPSGFDSAGLPTGLQVVGRRYDDLTVLRIARALERVRPWEIHRPPL